MLCEVCHKEQATVFLTEVINGKKIELHMCAACAAKEKARMYSDDSFQQFISGLLKLTGKEEEEDKKPLEECPGCHMTIDEFRKKSKLGCGQCYEVFKPYIKHIVKSVHGGDSHTGKQPLRLNEKEIKRQEIENLESSLKIALMQEDYQEAAKVRDLLAKAKEDWDE